MALRDEYYIIESDRIKIIKGDSNNNGVLTRSLVNRILEEVNGFSVYANILNQWKFKSFFIEIGGEIRNIEPGAFRDCEFINKLRIVKNDYNSPFFISNYAFFNCFNLETVEINVNTELFINKSVFANCTKLTNVNLSCKTIMIQQNAFMNCSSINTIIIPEKVSKVDAKSFCGCTGLKKIYIPRSYSNCPIMFYTTDAEVVFYDGTDEIGKIFKDSFNNESSAYESKSNIVPDTQKSSFKSFSGVVRPNLIANKKKNKL